MNNGEYWVGSFLRDTLKEGNWRLFYPNHTLEIQVSYHNGKEQGYCKGFYPSGKLKYEGFYKNGLKDSNQTYYYENGNVEEKFFADSGITMSDKFNYYETGGLKEYLFYDEKGVGRYRRRFDENGKLVKTEGKALLHFVANNKDSVEVNQIVKAAAVCANPPDCKRVLIFSEQSGLLPTINLSDSLKKNYIEFSFKPTRNGTYKTKLVLIITDDKTHNTEESSINDNFIVVK